MVIAKERKVNFYSDENGVEPVKDWFKSLRRKKKFVELTKIRTHIERAGKGNFGDHRFLGGNFGELKIDYGPGYRVYFGIDGDEIIILLNGGTKVSQQTDIGEAESRWENYISNKGEGNNHEK